MLKEHTLLIEKSEERFPMVQSTSTSVVTSLNTHLIHEAYWCTETAAANGIV